MTAKAPTLAQIRKWPAAVDVTMGATAFGLSRSSAYEAIARGDFPAKTITVGKRIKILTSSVLRVLEDGTAER